MKPIILTRRAMVRAGSLAVALPALGAPRAARAEPGLLRMGVGSAVTSLDPQYHSIGPNNAFAAIVFEPLVDTDGKSRLIPGLALSWKTLTPTLWEFKLRPNVTFHNGKPFTADDAVFTLERIPTVKNSPGSYRTYVYSISKAVAVDPLTLHLHTRAPDPLLSAGLTKIWILNRATHTGATTADFNSGAATIGTGPYKVVSVKLGSVTGLERYDAHWRGRPAWAKVTHRQIVNQAGRAAAVLSGDVDIIDQVPTADVKQMAREPGIRLSRSDSLRVIFLALDHMRTGSSPFITDNDGQPLDRNPLKDLRVRRALSMSIDRRAEVARVMEGVGIPTLQFMAKGTYGYVPDLEPPAHSDPEGARKLLAEAGYPDGFRITLHGSNDRYQNDYKIVQAVAQMWTRIGVRTAVNTAPYASFITKASKQEYSAFIASWGSSTGEPSPGLRSTAATWDKAKGMGSVNRGRYSNPKFDAELVAAMSELDDEKRETMMQQATRTLINDVGIIPIHLQESVWAMRGGITHEPRVDESTRPQDFHPPA